ncbi:hypothetical protein FBR04_01955 [Betaproteobacteria bacterium PRO7]|jgi:DNA-binding CsgD family transcriptional regulator|nr:LuxR C-terminal-related transcriptional regulator [Burkholderiaceae bacterium]MDL1859780.1 hypothetical protein [Betaproteobacteria bacterium PRO7]
MLRDADYRVALTLIGQAGEAAESVETFARCVVQSLPKLVAAELTTLSLCDLVHGRRLVAGVPQGTLSRELCEAFDRHFNEHPLVQYHAVRRGPGARRITDSISQARFRETDLYNDYYRWVGVDHVVALPLHVDDQWLVSFVLSRARRDFSDRDTAVLNAVGPALAAFYRQMKRLEAARATLPDRLGLDGAATAALTARESEVLEWVAAGKSDAQIGAILNISPRTVGKHLQHLYEKLGVESRTAAAMRVARRRREA